MNIRWFSFISPSDLHLQMFVRSPVKCVFNRSQPVCVYDRGSGLCVECDLDLENSTDEGDETTELKSQVKYIYNLALFTIYSSKRSESRNEMLVYVKK